MKWRGYGRVRDSLAKTEETKKERKKERKKETNKKHADTKTENKNNLECVLAETSFIFP